MWYLRVIFLGGELFFWASAWGGYPRGDDVGIERGGWMCRDSIGRPHVCIQFHRTHVYGEGGGFEGPWV